jgi:hypothetical protein
MRAIGSLCLILAFATSALAQASPPPKGLTPEAMRAWLAAKNERLKAREAQVRSRGQNARQLVTGEPK